MTYGPIQLVVLGFEHAALPLDFVNQLRRLRDDGLLRLVDAIFVAKDEHGELTHIQATDLDHDELVLLGVLARALFDIGETGDIDFDEIFNGLDAGHGEFGLSSDDIDEVADLIPRGTAAAFLLLEHVWAIGLKESNRTAGGRVIAHGWVTPQTLIEMGAEEAT